jgi:hypothetical protein
MDHRTEEKALFWTKQMILCWGDAALDVSSENGRPIPRRRSRIAPPSCRSQSISLLTPLSAMNTVTMSAHLLVHTLAVLSSCSNDAHCPAVHRVLLKVAHESLSIAQHSIPRPLAGSSTVITEVPRQACAVSDTLMPSTFLGWRGLNAEDTHTPTD